MAAGRRSTTCCDRLGIESRFVDGLRVTDRETMEVVEMVLAGTINKQLVSAINAAGGCAIGLSGKDGGLIEARKLTRNGRPIDLGFVGEPRADRRPACSTPSSNPTSSRSSRRSASAPTARPTTSTPTRSPARSPRRSRRRGFLLLTDVAGVLDADKRLIPELTAGEARRLIADGMISGGMIPKVETCLDAVEGGVEAAVIVDGRVPHAILLELFTEGAGTLIRAG